MPCTKMGLAMQDHKVVWDNPVVEDLLCECEVGNPHNTHAVRVKKVIYSNLTVVGHIPRRILSISSIFSVCQNKG